MYFASNIKFLRKRRGRTQDDVASALQMKRPTLSGYENGVAQPGIDALVAFSGYYNLSLDTMLKVDLTRLSESQLGELERGYDAYVRGSNLRVLTTTVTPDNRENIELVSEKAKATCHYSTCRSCHPTVNTVPSSSRVTPCCPYLTDHGLRVSFCMTGMR
jgi:transcriptional regulator with XRE-family HTH domain